MVDFSYSFLLCLGTLRQFSLWSFFVSVAAFLQSPKTDSRYSENIARLETDRLSLLFFNRIKRVTFSFEDSHVKNSSATSSTFVDALDEDAPVVGWLVVEDIFIRTERGSYVMENVFKMYQDSFARVVWFPPPLLCFVSFLCFFINEHGYSQTKENIFYLFLMVLLYIFSHSIVLCIGYPYKVYESMYLKKNILPKSTSTSVEL